MRTASMVLGIVGGCIALIFVLIAVFGAVMFTTVIPEIENSELFSENIDDMDSYDKGFIESTRIGGTMFSVMGGVMFLCAVLGIVGGALAKKKNVAAGVLMLVGAVISFFSVWGIFFAVLLLLGGIFALVRDRKSDTTVAQ